MARPSQGWYSPRDMGQASGTGLNGGRFLLATAVLGAGVAISQFGTNGMEQAMICFAAGIVAIVIMADLSSPAKHNPQAAAPIREPEVKPISQHRDFTSFIDGLADPVLVLTGKGRRTLDKGLPETLGPVDVYDSLAGFVDQFLKDPS